MTSTVRRLLSLLVVVLVASIVTPVAAQETIDDAREQREEARRRQLEAQISLNFLEAEDEEVRAALDAANELVAAQQARVDAAHQALDLAENERYRTETDLAWASQDIDVLRQAAKDFAIESYIRVPADGADAWLASDDLNRSARRAALLASVGRSAHDALDRLRAAEEDREELAARAGEAVERAESLESEVVAELVILEEAQRQQAEIKAEMDERIAEWERQLDSFESDEARLTEFIREKQLEAAGIGGNAQPGVESARGFVWPTDGRLGSGFGPRLHPILRYVRPHNGLDIGGNQGQPIWASKRGEVIVAGWNGGYGNSVVVLHEGGLSTLYAHMSAFAVSVGDVVDTGELIGQVGSTGLSTGPHLHFELRVEGNLTDPRPFLP